jgi:hypothetical protein
LDGEKTYFLGDSEWLDHPRGFAGLSIITLAADIAKNVMTSGFMCAYNCLRIARIGLEFVVHAFILFTS